MREFTLEELQDMEVEYCNVSKESIYKGRWTESFNVVFEFEGKNYSVVVQEGNTENQECYGADVFPDMWNGAVDCPEMESYVVPVTKWRKVAV